MNNDAQLRIIGEMFYLSEKGRVPTEVALKKIGDKISGLSDRKKGYLLRKCFGGQVKKMKPGKSKNVKNDDRKYHYYGIDLVLQHRDEVRATEELHTKTTSASPTPDGIEVVGNRKEQVLEISCLRRENENLKLENMKLKADLEKEKKTIGQRSTLVNKQHERHLKQLPSIPRMLYVNPCDVVHGKVIGMGSYGCCQLAEYKGLTVAMKTLTNRENLCRGKLKSRVEEEAKCMLKLKAHRNLPHLVGLFSKDDKFCLLMNFWGSQKYNSPTSLTLSEALRKNHLVCSVPWIDVVKQVAEGLGAIHGSGIIHNDIKGDNIVLQAELRYQPMIIDFGKATHTGEDATKYRLTKEGQIKWRRTYPWIAPELISNADIPSTVTDVYSLGYLVRCVVRKCPSQCLKQVVRITYNESPAKRASLDYLNQLIAGCVATT